MNVLVKAHMSRWSPMAVMACFGCCCVPDVYPQDEFDCGPSVSLAASPPPSACLSPRSAQGRCASLRDEPPAHPCPDAAAAVMGWLWGAQQRPGLAHSGPSERDTVWLMGTLRLQRTHQRVAILRRVRVEVDGAVAARLRRGESVDVSLASGPHSVSAHLDAQHSPTLEVSIREGDVSVVEVALPPLSLWRLVRHGLAPIEIAQR
jgi:hypothetical protein